MKKLAPYLVLSMTLMSSALSAKVWVSLYSPTEVTLQSNQDIRYVFDEGKSTLTLPDSEMDYDSYKLMPLQTERQNKTILFKLPKNTQFGLLKDSKQLRITLPTETSQTPASQEETPKEQKSRFPKIFYLENIKPKNAADIISKFFSTAQVEVDERQNALLVNTDVETHKAIAETLVLLDKSRPQVMFEAEIIEINRDMTQNLGIDYDDLITLKFIEDAPKGIMELGNLNRASGLGITMGIHALKNAGAAKVLAQPRVTTLDGIEAVINSTQSTPIVITGTQGGSIQTITTGITLRMTPRITPSGIVESQLVISVSSPTGSTTSGVPQFSSREARTTVRVHNGEPIAIGGLIEERNVKSDQKIPFLGDIPVVGALFTNTREEKRRSDLVIIVTPRLVLP